MATHCRRTEIQEVSDSNGRPLISSTTQPARPGNRRFCVLGPYAEGVGPGPGLLIGRLWRGSSLSTGPFPTTPFQTVLRFPAHGLTMIFVMWRAWRQRTDRTWPFDGSSLRLYEPSPESIADDPTWRTSIAGPRSCRAFTEGWLAVSGMPSRLPPRRLDQSRVSSLQRVLLHAFTGITDPSDSLPARRDFSRPPLYARSLPDQAAR